MQHLLSWEVSLSLFLECQCDCFSKASVHGNIQSVTATCPGLTVRSSTGQAARATLLVEECLDKGNAGALTHDDLRGSAFAYNIDTVWLAQHGL